MAQREWFIAVYMMSNRKHGTLYIGVSGSSLNRVFEHREGLTEGFRKSMVSSAWFGMSRTTA